ncbi:endo alpha-1,4 polygalactosaminidase [Patulibacter sp. SYSU D01012]|uniref:endo alpha-1,4 polygalactosaminidase n=1 Tax=Patulibacter sp. SYSU D01012 TaxID=2817381 RepID=UPI001B3130EC|nr:endo alpha-1,4 polygalactosaminidase [Patulibacter sp. SYSU D01012]
MKALRAGLVAATLGAVGLLGGTAQAALPPANGQFDYQIGGAYSPVSTVQIVDRDRAAAPVAGKYNVCYVNAFQTQPSEAAWWKAQHDDLLLKKNGAYVTDPIWKNEIVLDTRTAAKRSAIAAIVGGWFDGCAAAGFQAVEPDNLDSWDRSKGLVTTANNVALSKLLVARAHAAGLAIAQKNGAEIAPGAKASIGFDFAIAEECQVWGECEDYTDEYGDQVYEIEYVDEGGLPNFQAACAARGAQISIIYRDRAVAPRPPAGAPAGDEPYVYQAC